MEDHIEAVKRTGKRWTAADKAQDKAREEHFMAVIAALRAGEQPTEVYESSPFTATHLRGLARRVGIPAGKRSRKPDESPAS